jgi:hypothetical protein
MTSLWPKKGWGGSGELGRWRGAAPAAVASTPAKGRCGLDNTRAGEVEWELGKALGGWAALEASGGRGSARR